MYSFSKMMKLVFRDNEPQVDARDEDGNSFFDEDAQFELTHVGSYEIVAPIGSGGMGTVYKAIDRSRDQTVAVKVLDRRYDLDKKSRSRDYLGREQEDVQGNKRRCLLMEFIDGHDLKRHINERDLSMRKMLDVCIKLCQGLDFLHQNGIVHRDIKPANFMLPRGSDAVKILDFGLSESNQSWRTRFMKKGGGTRLYMSPEQLKKQRLDHRSDIFSFGITMYEFFAGRHPCNGMDTREIQRQLIDPRYKFEPPSKYNSEIPPHLDKVLLKALRRKLDQRYQSMTEMLLDLSRMGTTRI